MSENVELIVERHDRLGDALGLDLLLVRDDLLPFPLAGNKVRKLKRELQDLVPGQVLLSNGGIDSNHCRTLAMLGARLGAPVHLILHTEAGSGGPSLELLTRLGASYEIVRPPDIGNALDRAEITLSGKGLSVRRIAGGCHTPAGAQAFCDAGRALIGQWRPDAVVVASGTGATQGGLAAAAFGTGTSVLGISVARGEERGAEAVAEAATWAGAPDIHINFFADFRDGGYGQHGQVTDGAIAYGWKHGLPLDPTYTGKAFAAILSDGFRADYLRAKRVVFWHTGGMMNLISDAVFRVAKEGTSFVRAE